MIACSRCSTPIKAGDKVQISRSPSKERIYSHAEACPDRASRLGQTDGPPRHTECLPPGERYDGQPVGLVQTEVASRAASTEAPKDDRCPHEMLPGQCSYCKPPPNGLPQQVWTTEGGQTFHALASCPALQDGQAYADRLGMHVHPIKRQSVYEVLSSRGQCTACFSAQDLADYAAWKRRKRS